MDCPNRTPFAGLPISVWLAVVLYGLVGFTLLTLAQVPSFWTQAVFGGIILVSLMLARFTGGKPRT